MLTILCAETKHINITVNVDQYMLNIAKHIFKTEKYTIRYSFGVSKQCDITKFNGVTMLTPYCALILTKNIKRGVEKRLNKIKCGNHKEMITSGDVL